MGSMLVIMLWLIYIYWINSFIHLILSPYLLILTCCASRSPHPVPECVYPSTFVISAETHRLVLGLHSWEHRTLVTRRLILQSTGTQDLVHISHFSSLVSVCLCGSAVAWKGLWLLVVWTVRVWEILIYSGLPNNEWKLSVLQEANNS